MRRSSVLRWLVGFIAITLVVFGSLAGSPNRGGSEQSPEIEVITFVDYAAHAGPGPHPAGCSGKFRLTAGGVSWSEAAISYDLIEASIPAGIAAAAADVQAAFDVWKSEEPAAPQFGEASGSANTVSWGPLGAGIVAVTSFSIIPPTKRIVSFDITFNSDVAWSLDGAIDTFDVLNIGVHEAGHAYGLGHVNGPKNGLESMYRLTATSEIIKRDLCTGDVAGIAALY